ncbi:hypothetical protein [Rhodoblastus sp.]|uniref:hypothetical protein n=1 Tax=Rhodoblastus sp. TaxID=1962975 RepID=UPI0025FDAC6B|nr:hypothetical protein [Rhodoblastus sp.]
MLYENANTKERTAFIWLCSYLWGKTRHRWRGGPSLAQILLRAEPTLFPTALWGIRHRAEPFLPLEDSDWLDDENASESDIIKFAASRFVFACAHYSIIALRRTDAPIPRIALAIDKENERKRIQSETERETRARAEAERAARLAERRRGHPKADEWPTLDKQKLENLVSVAPLSKLSKIYGVSDVAIAKRCKRLEIPLPGRGYWAKRYAAEEKARVEKEATHPKPLRSK